MDFFEIEGKVKLREYNIPTDNGVLYTAEHKAEDFEFPCVVKSQALSGKRGKAGGIKFPNNAEELKEAVETISNLVINGKKVEGVVVCEKLDIKDEFYLGLTLDTKEKRMLMLFTPFGGMDIEELAEKSPEKLIKLDVTDGFDKKIFEETTKLFNLSGDIMAQVLDISEKLTKACFELDATTIEINPLALLGDGRLVAADTKLVIDDNALYRHGDYTLIERSAEEVMSEREEVAANFDLIYIELDTTGDIGVMAGGAGIGMATVDTIANYGGKAYNFLDLGGGVTAEKTYNATKLLLENPNIKAIFINVFGGINNCADMAEGIERAYLETKADKLIVVKSRGFNQEQGWEIYEKHGFKQCKYGTTDEAVAILMKAKEGTL